MAGKVRAAQLRMRIPQIVPSLLGSPHLLLLTPQNIPKLREMYEDLVDLRSGRKFPEFDFPGPPPHEWQRAELINWRAFRIAPPRLAPPHTPLQTPPPLHPTLLPCKDAKVITSQSCSQTSPPCSFGPTIQMAGRQDHWLGERGRGTDPRRTEHPPHLVHFHIPSHGINISSLPLPPFSSLLFSSLHIPSFFSLPPHRAFPHVSRGSAVIDHARRTADCSRHLLASCAWRSRKARP